MHNTDNNVSLSWMWVQSTAPLYLIHAVPHTGWSEGSGVDRCFPGWNHDCWIFICDYTSCGGSGGNWTHCKWFLLWRKIKLLGVSLYLQMTCLSIPTNTAHVTNCEIKFLLKEEGGGVVTQFLYIFKQAYLVWRIFFRFYTMQNPVKSKTFLLCQVGVLRTHFGFHWKWMVNRRGQLYLYL